MKRKGTHWVREGSRLVRVDQPKGSEPDIGDLEEADDDWAVTDPSSTGPTWWDGLRPTRIPLQQVTLHGRGRVGALSIEQRSGDLGLFWSSGLTGKTKVWVPLRSVTHASMTQVDLPGASGLPSSFRSGYVATGTTAALFGLPATPFLVGKAIRRHNQKQRALLVQAQGPRAVTGLMLVADGVEYTFRPARQDAEQRFVRKFEPMARLWQEAHPASNRSGGLSSEHPILVADELRKLADLRNAGVLTREEFDVQKARLLSL